MKKILFVLLAASILVAVGCAPRFTTAHKAPEKIVLKKGVEASLSDDARYFKTLIDQYIEDESQIAANVREKMPEWWDDKEQQMLFIKEFEKNGLTRQQGLQAYVVQKETVRNSKDLVNLPSGVASGTLMPTKGKMVVVAGKNISAKDTLSLSLTYKLKDPEAKQKYDEIAADLTTILSGKGWLKKTQEDYYISLNQSADRMQKMLNQYKGNRAIIPDPDKYKANIDSMRQNAEDVRQKPQVNFSYSWKGDTVVGSGLGKTTMPNNLNIRLNYFKDNAVDGDQPSITLTMIKVIY